MLAASCTDRDRLATGIAEAHFRAQLASLMPLPAEFTEFFVTTVLPDESAIAVKGITAFHTFVRATAIIKALTIVTNAAARSPGSTATDFVVPPLNFLVSILFCSC